MKAHLTLMWQTIHGNGSQGRYRNGEPQASNNQLQTRNLQLERLLKRKNAKSTG